jgi:iron complex outermembrane receptor protein
LAPEADSMIMSRCKSPFGLVALRVWPVVPFVAICEGQKAIHNLSEASLKDLMNIEVTTVSKKQQKLSKSPAAVYVLTAEDIRCSGMTNIPDLLRMVPGLQVARIEGASWAVSARGFNSQYGNKMLVLVDGRSVYTPRRSTWAYFGTSRIC